MKKPTRKKIDENKTVDAVKTLQATDVVNEIGTLQVSIQSTLANISGAITGKLAELSNTETAIASLEERLNELYLIEKEALSLEEMKANRAEEQERYNKMVMARNAEWNEAEAERTKQWQREDEEHNYNALKNRSKFNDEYLAQVEAAKRNERIRQEELNKSWAARETELKNQEGEVANLKKLVGDFDSRIKTEVAKAEAIATNAVKKQYEHQIALMQKDIDAERSMNAANVKSFQVQVGQMHDQIQELTKQLMAARNDAKEVTAQALQSASGRQVADALQRVVDSKDTGKTK